MLLRQIKYFVTVVDTGSFTEAAEECFISQSASFMPTTLSSSASFS